MYRERRIGRNSPCPCGSGKKYKRCCGATTNAETMGRKEPDYFMMNKEIAYRGRIGQQREKFCVDYLEEKKKNFHLMENAQIQGTLNEGEAISCHRGCNYCCSVYVEANIQDCEAIVYYLYHHDELLTAFLHKYPAWREAIREYGDLYKSCGRFWDKELTKENAGTLMREYTEEVRRYHEQDIPCPFLDDGICSIYEVRPYACAAHIAVSPPEWCSSENPSQPETRKAVPTEIMSDCTFYYRNLSSPVVTFMPIAVYEILKSGVAYFSLGRVPRLENLDSELLSDPEVKPVLMRYGIGKS